MVIEKMQTVCCCIWKDDALLLNKDADGRLSLPSATSPDDSSPLVIATDLLSQICAIDESSLEYIETLTLVDDASQESDVVILFRHFLEDDELCSSDLKFIWVQRKNLHYYLTDLNIFDKKLLILTGILDLDV